LAGDVSTPRDRRMRDSVDPWSYVATPLTLRVAVIRNVRPGLGSK
jgi:hypothetical protein